MWPSRQGAIWCVQVHEIMCFVDGQCKCMHICNWPHTVNSEALDILGTVGIARILIGQKQKKKGTIIWDWWRGPTFSLVNFAPRFFFKILQMSPSSDHQGSRFVKGCIKSKAYLWVLVRLIWSQPSVNVMCRWLRTIYISALNLLWQLHVYCVHTYLSEYWLMERVVWYAVLP